ncbi:hypothetical protein UK12_34515, partial [Saccharothrix sp. ST-888]
SGRMVAGLFAFAPRFGPAVHGHYLLGGFWQTWLLAVVSAGLGGPAASLTLRGDYTREVSPTRRSGRKVRGSAIGGLLLRLLIPQLFGSFPAVSCVAGDYYVAGLVGGA